MKLEEKRRVYEKSLIHESNLGFENNLLLSPLAQIKCNFKTYCTVPPWFWKQSILKSTATNATVKHSVPLFINKTVDRDIENNNESDKHGSHNNIITAFA